MSDNEDIDYKAAQRELHEAINELRRLQGQEPIPFQPHSEQGNGRHKDLEYCSFCGKGKSEVQRLIAGPSVYICNECVILAKDLLNE